MRLVIAIVVLVAIAVPAAAQDAGPAEDELNLVPEPSSGDVLEATVRGADGGVYWVQGGCWLSERYCLGFAKELASKRARVTHLEEHAGDAPKMWLLSAFALGGLLGAIVPECANGTCFGLRR